jgi:predicted transcriptional regulator
MAETTTITVRVPIEIKERLDKLAGLTERSRSYLATEALEIYTQYELEIVEGILQGMAEFDAGNFYTSAQMEAELEKLVKDTEKDKTRAKKAAHT